LHSNNLMIGMINQDGMRVAHRKLPCDLNAVEKFLRPYKAQLQSMAVESTFNWYWLVDGLRQRDYPIDLANPARIEQYGGMKHVDDKDDAYHLAELQRLKILPKAHVYDPQLRPVRDLLRRRTMLVQQRTALLLSFKSLYMRTTGQALDLSEAEKLLTIPGIGRILGMTITMEVGDIQRFKTDGDFASYCRTVDARRLSNGKVKADNNQKCGNKYLAWAFVEAANFARRFDEPSRRWYDRKAAKTSKIIATKALACKLAKASWHVMSGPCDYDAKRMFPQL